jgi:GDP-L-fucose synthase
MNILILGASGFVGRNVSKIFDLNKIAYRAISSEDVDLLNSEVTQSYLKNDPPDFIINCAAHVGSLNYVSQNAADIITDNSRMILNLYEAVSLLTKRPVLINPIANCAYPSTSQTFSEEQLWNGQLHRSVLAYGASRRFLLYTAECYSWQHDIKSIHLLVPNMYGPFDSTDPNKSHALNALVSKFVKAEKEKKKEIEIWGTGVAIREWLYAEDFGRIILEIINSKKTTGFAEPVNIAQNSGLSVKELVEIINGFFDNKFNIRWNESMPDGAARKVMDDRKFRKIFGNFVFTEFGHGVKKTVDYYNSIYPY